MLRTSEPARGFIVQRLMEYKLGPPTTTTTTTTTMSVYRARAAAEKRTSTMISRGKQAGTLMRDPRKGKGREEPRRDRKEERKTSEYFAAR